MSLIEFDSATQTFLLTTPMSGYVVRLADAGVRPVHWGEPLSLSDAASIALRPTGRDGEIFGEELPGEGGLRFGPPSLIVEFAGGVRAVEWEHAGHEISDGTLRIALADRNLPLRLELCYRIYPDSDVIERWSRLTHTGGPAPSPIRVERLDSAAWTIPQRDDYRLSHVTGEWSAEFILERTRLPYGESISGSRRGTTRHQVNPWLAIDAGDASEEHGEVWTVALAWSGGFRLHTRRTLGGHVTVAGGTDPGAEGVRALQPGESFQTPVMAGAYAANGFGEASRIFHAYTRRHVLPHPEELPPVLYNSWESTGFDVTETNQIETARIAASLGIELYVMDDGWFGARDHDAAGLGDWTPNPVKFPNGLKPLADEVHALGMKFGIWVEPEMVNPDSDLYRGHPDWTLHMTGRTRTEMRNQLVLNFGRPDVVDWAEEWLDELVGANGVDFLKWDMNRPFTEAGWPGADDPGRLWIDYTDGVYAVMDRLRARHPALRIESCASGGGRADFGVLRRTDQAWTSDNADPVDRLAIQHGFSQIYPAITMAAWATASPNPITGRATPLRFRMHSAMAGALGISGDLREWPDEERAEAAALIRAYQQIRPLVAHGDAHRLAHGPALTAVEHVAPDRSSAVVLAFRPSPRYGEPEPPLRLRGLDPDASYRDQDGQAYRGAVLMRHGIDVYSRMPAGDYGSIMIHLVRA